MSRRHRSDQRSQKQQILDHLRSKGSITPMEGLINYGMTRMAARVDELRQDGWIILTLLSTDERGSRYARYFPVPRQNRTLLNRVPRGEANPFCRGPIASPPMPTDMSFCMGA